MQNFWRTLFVLAWLVLSWEVVVAQEHDKQDSFNKDIQHEEKAQNNILSVSKNGILFGIELSGGFGEIFQNASLLDPALHQAFKNSKKIAFDGGLKVGYQHYFGLGLGIRVGGYMGVGNPIGQKLSIKKDSTTHATVDFEISYLPIKTGVDLEGLWDFWEEGKHTLSLSFGVGYRFVYYKNIQSSSNDFLVSLSPLDEMLHEVYPQIGLSYYYERHQISLSYKFGDLLSSKSSGTVSEIVENSTGSKRGEIWTQLIQRSYFSIGYSYRF